MIGLIVKGATALFLEGADPGTLLALALVDAVRSEDSRSWASHLDEIKLQRVARPKPLTREFLGWVYVFVMIGEPEHTRLEPGPFDDELARLVEAIEAERHHDAGSA
jgi:hypothetical protein